jgi:hypothetical protein
VSRHVSKSFLSSPTFVIIARRCKTAYVERRRAAEANTKSSSTIQAPEGRQ